MPTSQTIDPSARFREDGFYLAQTPVLPAGVVDAAVEGMDAIRRGESNTGRSPEGGPWSPGDDPNKLCKIEQPQFADSRVWELVSHPALGELAARITGAAMVQAWWVQLLYKPPFVGDPTARTNVGWHQDRQYWGQWEDGSELFTAWVALSDVREECGPMRFLRGSHLWGFRESGDFYAQDLDAQRSELRVPDGEILEEVPALLPPGGVSFHHLLTFHGSGPNMSNEPRRSFAIHMRTEKSRPKEGKREGLTQFIDDPRSCPVIFGEWTEGRMGGSS